MVCILSIIKIYSFHLFSLLCQRSSSFWKYRKRCRYFENPYHHAKIADKKTMIALWSCQNIALEIMSILWQIFACLSKTVIKTLKQNVTFVQTFFYHPFDCRKVIFGPMARRKPQSPNVNDKTISSDKFTGLPKSDGKHQWDSRWKPSDSEYNVISHFDH